MRRTPWTRISLPRTGHDFVFATGPVSTREDPATGEPVADAATSTLADVKEAVAAARAAFADPSWRNDGSLRSRVLTRHAARLREEAERLAELLTREQGKTMREAQIEIAGAADLTEFAAAQARMLYGRSLALGPDVHGVVLREPVGVIAIITPWNWPITLLYRSLAPALAAGNTCVVKPASLTSAVSVEALALGTDDPELPRNAYTCVLGPGEVVGDALVGNRDVDMVAFTGDSDTGVRVMKRAADGLHKVALELGGKSPNVVFADAKLDKAMEGAHDAAFTSCGQICTAGSRLLVEAPIYEEVLDRLSGIASELTIGDGLDEATTLGPLVSSAQRAKVLEFVAHGSAEGTLVAGGKVPDGPSFENGHFLEATVFADLPSTSPLIEEEIFGPVITVQAFEDEDEAVALANGPEFGLAAGVWTSDLDRAWRVGRAIRAGTVWINTYHHFYAETEVGGVKRSGIGRQSGVEGLFEFTETKHLNFDGTPTLW